MPYTPMMNPSIHRYGLLSLRQFIRRRCIHSSVNVRHENPLGLPSRSNPPPTIPRRGIPQKRRIPHVKYVVVVASGKGGVGKSTIAVNLAFALALKAQKDAGIQRRPRVGLLDLDIFGPSIPKLMGLDNAEEPLLTTSGAIIPLVNHGLSCMSMGFLLPHTKDASREDTPIVWRGLMVQKAVQQLLFDVDWREGGRGGNAQSSGTGLDVLVIDMPPGTGDVALTLGQLVEVDSALIVSTPQDISLSDVRKGVAMFRKVSIPILGVLLNTSHFICPSCTTLHHLFGPSDTFFRVASRLNVDVLAELPLVPAVSMDSDKGMPYMLTYEGALKDQAIGGEQWRKGLLNVAERVWQELAKG